MEGSTENNPNTQENGQQTGTPSFFDVEKELLDIEESCENKDRLPNLLSALLHFEIAVQKSGTFSKNEELDDIKSLDIKYLLLPFYIAKCYQLMKTPDGMKQRRTHLRSSEAQLEKFLNRCADYKLLTKDQEKMRDQKEGSVDATTARNQRIAGEKDKLALKKKIDFLMMKRKQIGANTESDDLEEIEREIYLEKVKMAVIEVILGKKIRDQEFQLLDFALKREEQQLPPLEREESTPFKVTRITKDPRTGNILTKELPVQRSTVSTREQIYRDVFKPNANGPTMSLEEYARQEMEDLHERSHREKEANEKREKEQEALENDDEEALEKKRKEDSSWDDWKDENPKGQGNMMR